MLSGCPRLRLGSPKGREHTGHLALGLAVPVISALGQHRWCLLLTLIVCYSCIQTLKIAWYIKLWILCSSVVRTQGITPPSPVQTPRKPASSSSARSTSWCRTWAPYQMMFASLWSCSIMMKVMFPSCPDSSTLLRHWKAIQGNLSM